MTALDLRDMQTVLDGIRERFSARISLAELPAGQYAAMRYPRLIPIMRFSFRHYDAPPFGHASFLRTTGMGGRMQLATAVLTPSTGLAVPLLLVDAMSMGRKRAVFVEYYDLTRSGVAAAPLAAVHDRYADLPDYPERPAWYVAERTPYSLIKGGTDDRRLCAMVADAVDAYASLCADAPEASADDLEGLRGFADRMVEEGNPSSDALSKVLGREGAERFFRTAIMPVKR
ncbi:MAG: hypothetical protein WAY93_01370 [Atopobiaceae bacterium]|jgi:hypothetical protein|nr:hypothetical protein [Atopobiaceae bacterium]